MELSEFIPHIEALVFASDKPLTAVDITELINNAMGFIDDRASLEQIETAIEGIEEKYHADFYAFELKQIGGGWQFLTKPAYHKTVAQLNGDKFIKKLSTAALETLAIIAYKQPITKSEVESIRGVNCDYAVQKLLEKDLVVISGRNEEAVGKPLIYATSKSFMDYFGINRPEDLPKIDEVLLEKYEAATRVTALQNPTDEAQPDASDNSTHLNMEMDTEVFITEETESPETDLTTDPISENDSNPTVADDEEIISLMDEAETQTNSNVSAEENISEDDFSDEENENDLKG